MTRPKRGISVAGSVRLTPQDDTKLPPEADARRWLHHHDVRATRVGHRDASEYPLRFEYLAHELFLLVTDFGEGSGWPGEPGGGSIMLKGVGDHPRGLSAGRTSCHWPSARPSP